jgi:hypothetical protein
LQEKIFKSEKDGAIIEDVIPQLIAYKSIMVIRDIELRKA